MNSSEFSLFFHLKLICAQFLILPIHRGLVVGKFPTKALDQDLLIREHGVSTHNTEGNEAQWCQQGAPDSDWLLVEYDDIHWDTEDCHQRGQETPLSVINKGVKQARDIGEALLLEQTRPKILQCQALLLKFSHSIDNRVVVVGLWLVG